MISTGSILGFWFSPDGIIRLLTTSAWSSHEIVESCLIASAANAHEWLTLGIYWGGIWKIRDVDPTVLLFQTLEKEKVRNSSSIAIEQTNCEENATSMRPSLQHASVVRTFTEVNMLWFVIVIFFFFWFLPKATRAGDEKQRKRSTWPYWKRSVRLLPIGLHNVLNSALSLSLSLYLSIYLSSGRWHGSILIAYFDCRFWSSIFLMLLFFKWPCILFWHLFFFFGCCHMCVCVITGSHRARTKAEKWRSSRSNDDPGAIAWLDH